MHQKYVKVQKPLRITESWIQRKLQQGQVPFRRTVKKPNNKNDCACRNSRKADMKPQASESVAPRLRPRDGADEVAGCGFHPSLWFVPLPAGSVVISPSPLTSSHHATWTTPGHHDSNVLPRLTETTTACFCKCFQTVRGSVGTEGPEGPVQ